MFLWNCYGAFRSAHISMEVILSSHWKPVANKVSVIQYLAHSQQGGGLLTMRV